MGNIAWVIFTISNTGRKSHGMTYHATNPFEEKDFWLVYLSAMN